jgi:adenosylcobinamide-GDP ribazoletransferase
VALLTRVPVGAAPLSAHDLRRAPACFPLVGLGLGAGAALAFRALAPAGPFVAGAVAVGLLLLLTGALHEDGLADTADALGGAPPGDRARLFAILKDSRIGSFGAAALGLSLLLRVLALGALGDRAPAALVFVAAASRAFPVWLMAALPYVTPVETARSGDAVRAGWTQATVATACALLFALGWGVPHLGPAALLALWAAGVATALLGWRFWVRAGGITGDFLGATQQVAEVVLLVTLARQTG